MRGRAGQSPLPWLGALLVLYLVVPFVGLVVHLVSTGQRGFGVPGLWSALGTSVLTASISTGIIAALGIPLAFSLSRATGRLADVVGVLVLLPLALPPLVSGILLISVLGPHAWIGRLTGGRLTDSLAGVVAAQTFVAAPFLIVAARSAFASVEPPLAEVAATLGLGPMASFWRVSLVVAWPGVAAGLLLAWLRAFGEFGATIILAYHPYTIPVFSYVQFSASGLTDTLAPAVLAVIAAGALGVAALAVVGRRPRVPRRQPALPPPARPAGAAPGPVGFRVDRRLGTFHLEVAYEGRAGHLAVLGPSGAGKSTLLRALAGLLGTGSDEVHLEGTELGALPPERRHVGYVPQDPSLLPNRSLWHQLVLSPRAAAPVAAFWLDRLGLDGLEHRLPAELSGGQRQRVALARALCADSQVLLLDEPLSALDTPVRRELRNELRHLLAEAPVSSVLVTHDPEEAALLADEILVVCDGRLLQAGPRAELFARPCSLEVARLLGVRNVALGRLGDDGRLQAGALTIGLPEVLGPRPPAGTEVLWRVAPEEVRLATHGLAASVLDVADLGLTTEVVVELAPGIELAARAPSGLSAPVPTVGERCSVELGRGAIWAWGKGEEVVLS